MKEEESQIAIVRTMHQPLLVPERKHVSQLPPIAQRIRKGASHKDISDPLGSQLWWYVNAVRTSSH
jgi:hypothetical protein